MRAITLLLLGATLASCAYGPPTPPPMHSSKGAAQLNELLAGKAAQAPVSCLPYYRSSSNDMIVVDDSTVAFRTSAARVYVARMAGSCTNLSSGGPYALVTRQSGTTSLCHGDIAQVVDTMAHVTVGSCVFGDFVPYVRQGG